MTDQPNAAERAEPVDLTDLETRVQEFHDRGIVNRGIFAVNEVEALIAEVRTLRAERDGLRKAADMMLEGTTQICTALNAAIEELESALASEREKVASQRALLVSVADFLGPIAISPSGKRLYAAVTSVLDTTNEGAETE